MKQSSVRIVHNSIRRNKKELFWHNVRKAIIILLFFGAMGYLLHELMSPAIEFDEQARRHYKSVGY